MNQQVDAGNEVHAADEKPPQEAARGSRRETADQVDDASTNDEDSHGGGDGDAGRERQSESEKPKDQQKDGPSGGEASDPLSRTARRLCIHVPRSLRLFRCNA